MVKRLSIKLGELMRLNNMSLEELAERSGLPLPTVRNLYYGKVDDPKVSTLLAISKVFNTSINCLVGECHHTPDERALLQYYRACGNHGKSLVRISAKYEALSAKEEREAVGKHSIECLIPHCDIYHGIVYDECQTETQFTAVPEAVVGIKMTNNCLMPVYCQGDVILVADRFPLSSEYGVFYYHGRAYIREYVERDGKYILKCLHKFDKDMVFDRMDDIECLGTCCGVIRK